MPKDPLAAIIWNRAICQSDKIINAGIKTVGNIVNALFGKNSSSKTKQNTEKAKNTSKINDGSSQNKKTSSNKATNTKVKVKEPEPCPEPVSSKALDVLQFVLDVIGFFPGVGDFADAVNAFISFARGNPLEAMISIGCIVFTVVADTLLKPLKWAAGSAVEIARKIADKLPNFASKTISYVKSIPGAIKQIPLVRKGYDTVKDISVKLANYIDNLFKSAQRSKLWDLPPLQRGLEIEKTLSKKIYSSYEYVGEQMGGKFPVFDFIKGDTGISVKTMDVTLNSYQKPSAIKSTIHKYMRDANRHTNNDVVNNISKRIVDLYVPKGEEKVVKKALGINENYYTYNGVLLNIIGI